MTVAEELDAALEQPPEVEVGGHCWFSFLDADTQAVLNRHFDRILPNGRKMTNGAIAAQIRTALHLDITEQTVGRHRAGGKCRCPQRI